MGKDQQSGGVAAGVSISNRFALLNKRVKEPKAPSASRPAARKPAEDRQLKGADFPKTAATREPKSVKQAAKDDQPAAPAAAEVPAPAKDPKPSQLHRAKKEEDRKTDHHVSRTGRGPDAAKGGAGKGNWGDKDTRPEWAEEKPAADGWGEETPAPEAPPAAGWTDEEKKPSAPAGVPGELTAAEKAKLDAEEAEKEAKQMTLAEFKAQQSATLVTAPEVRKVDASQFKNMKVLKKEEEILIIKKKEAEKEAAKPDAGKKEKDKKAAPAKPAAEVHVAQHKEKGSKDDGLAAMLFKMDDDRSHGGRGRGRGRSGPGEGRGLGRGGRGRGPRPSPQEGEGARPTVTDESSFPSLPGSKPVADAAAPAVEAAAASSN